MVTRPKKTPVADDAPAYLPQTSPIQPLSGHGDHSFTLQAIMEMQKTLGELNSKFENLNSSVNSTKSKVEDLVTWKNKILGGAIALGIIGTLLGFLITKGWDYVSIKQPEPKNQQQNITQPLTNSEVKPPEIFSKENKKSNK
ncbi:hypothetical protein [Undibacterium sp. Di24W]|uniref:hypothetical protein n=1 Tax=Undibacterium sp. Di24W TaxID=3413033 RepID=UPI003BF0F8B3